MGLLAHDLVQAFRQLRRRPVFTAAALLTLGIGIAASTAIFSLVDRALLRPLPYPHADRLVQVFGTGGDRILQRHELSHPDFVDLRSGLRSFQALAGYRGRGTLALQTPEGQVPLSATAATAGFFDLLGAPPAVGREFRAEETRRGGPPAVMLSHGLWAARFGGDASILGHSLVLDGKAHPVVGVLPAGFSLPGRAPSDVWLPAQPSEREEGNRGAYRLNTLGRLQDGVDPAEAQAELDTLGRRLAAAYAGAEAGGGFLAVPLEALARGPVRPLLLALLAAVGLVLLIACANIANLQLAHLSSRGRELAVRAALGADRRQLVQQMVLESLVLGLLGGALGALLAAWGLGLVRGLLPEGQRLAFPFLAAAAVDPRALGFTFLIALGTGLGCGLLPALQASRNLRLAASLQGRALETEGPGGRRLRRSLAVAELALGLVLLAGAGLAVQSFLRVLNRNPGFQVRGLATAGFQLPRSRAADPAALVRANQDLRARLEALPGVRGATTVDVPPLNGGGNTSDYTVEGRPEPRPGERPSANIRTVAPGYFAVLGIPLRRGRAFGPEEEAPEPRRVVINQLLADQVFQGVEPLGQRLRFEGAAGLAAWEIIGVAGNEVLSTLDGRPTPAVYFPFAQDPGVRMAVLVREDGEGPGRLLGAVRKELQDLDPGALITGLGSLERTLQNTPDAFRRRFLAQLTACFGGAAAVLALLGVYGVVAFSVGQRRLEFGIRMALGARAADILALVLGEGLRIVGAGLGLGLVGCLVLSRLLAGLLFGIAPWDPATLGAATLLLGATALAACLPPALGAARVDPGVALRSE
ncbi:MAG: ABC transporter permease [Holophagaceae bacterium]|nr:ABC transporter permease [Holophagaceae bacterium]